MSKFVARLQIALLERRTIQGHLEKPEIFNESSL